MAIFAENAERASCAAGALTPDGILMAASVVESRTQRPLAYPSAWSLACERLACGFFARHWRISFTRSDCTTSALPGRWPPGNQPGSQLAPMTFCASPWTIFWNSGVLANSSAARLASGETDW